MLQRDKDADFLTLHHLMLKLVQGVAGKQIDNGDGWLNSAQSLSRKLFEHLASLRQLIEPHRITIGNTSSFQFIDHSSVKVVTRAAFETYLVFHFIFGGSNSSRSKFRHQIWEYGGLDDRQRIDAYDDQARHILAVEKTRMDELRAEFEVSPHFAAYSKDAKKRILRGDWKGTDQWPTMAREAGFHGRYFEQIYNYLCGFSHASYISSIQVGQAQMITDQKMLAGMCIDIALILMSHFARAYTALFPATKPILDGDALARAAIDCWGIYAQDWDDMLAKRSAP